MSRPNTTDRDRTNLLLATNAGTPTAEILSRFHITREAYRGFLRREKLVAKPVGRPRKKTALQLKGPPPRRIV